MMGHFETGSSENGPQAVRNEPSGASLQGSRSLGTSVSPTPRSHCPRSRLDRRYIRAYDLIDAESQTRGILYRVEFLMKVLICVIFSIVLSIYFWVKIADTHPILKIEQLREEYERTKATITKQRNELNSRYLQSQTAQERERILYESQSLLIRTLTERIFPAWHGTHWGFYGMSRVPGEGEIACGTFVVFTLQDVGFDIPTRMAQQPSENILKNFIGNTGIKRFSNHVPMEKIIAWIQGQGEGVFLVGLDIHVGFIIYINNVISFCHANYYNHLEWSKINRF
jgi:hypothetical protein